MSNAYIIETPRYAAGIVTGEAGGFRFFAAHPEMTPLDGALFASPKAAEAAAARLAEARGRRAGAGRGGHVSAPFPGRLGAEGGRGALSEEKNPIY